MAQDRFAPTYSQDWDVRVRAIDALGQVDPTPESAAWRVRR